MKTTLLSWSSGKDSAWTLYQLQRDPGIRLAGIFCTVNIDFNRVAMHAVRVELLKRQAEAIDLPLEMVEIPYPCSNAAYESIMGEYVTRAKKAKVDCFAFGDLFLQDVRDYRIKNLRNTGITPIFPIWGQPTDKLSKKMVEEGLRAVITCVDPKQMPSEFVGQEYDRHFLDKLPRDVDPCGENGEFHSFAYAGPMFNVAIEVSVGSVTHRDGFVFADVLAENVASTTALESRFTPKVS